MNKVQVCTHACASVRTCMCACAYGHCQHGMLIHCHVSQRLKFHGVKLIVNDIDGNVKPCKVIILYHRFKQDSLINSHSLTGGPNPPYQSFLTIIVGLKSEFYNIIPWFCSKSSFLWSSSHYSSCLMVPCFNWNRSLCTCTSTQYRPMSNVCVLSHTYLTSTWILWVRVSN